MMLLLLLALSSQTPAQRMMADWQAALPHMQRSSKGHIPELSLQDMERLRQGKVIGRRLPSELEVDGAQGIAFLEAGVEAIWVGGLDDKHAQLAAGLTEVWLPGSNPERKILYQNLQVPAPFSDRHWVVQIRSNRELYEQSDGAVWERYWALDPRPLEECLEDLPEGSVEIEPDTVFTPVNRGSWSIIPTDGGSLVVYEVHSDIGGAVPEELMTRFAMLSLDSFMGKLEELGTRAPSHYIDAHYLIHRPDGSAIEPGAVKASEPG